MKQDSARYLADGAATLAVSTGAGNYYGWFDFINQNAAGIGVIISFLSFCVAVTFYIMTYRKSDNSHKNTDKIKELESQIDSMLKRKSKDK